MENEVKRKPRKIELFIENRDLKRKIKEEQEKNLILMRLLRRYVPEILHDRFKL